jgi:hypothetical protein
MNQLRSLDKIIKEVDANYQPRNSAEQIVIVDKRKKSIIPKKSLFTGLFGSNNLAFYLVGTAKDDLNVAVCQNLSYTVLDFASNTKLDILIDYRARCTPNNAEKLALALYSDETPIDGLDRKILSWVTEIIGSKALQFIENFATEVKSLENKLQNKAKEDIGLTLELRIHTQSQDVLQQAYIKRIIAENKLKPFAPSPISFDVKVSDYDDDLVLQTTIILEVDEDRKNEAAVNYGRESLLINIIKDEIKKYFLHNVSLQDAYDKLQTTISDAIKKQLNQILVAKGRKIGYLSLIIESISNIKERLSLKEFLEIKDFEVPCRIKGYDKPIKVINTLQMELEDIGKYSAVVAAKQLPVNKEGKPNLDYWATNKLETIIKPLLLEKEYVDILLDFEPQALEQQSQTASDTKSYSKLVRDKIGDAAKSIGYSVRHIVSIPDLEPFKLKGNCTLQTGEREYATKDANVRVKLSTVAIAKIEDLRKVRSRLNPEVPLQAQMEEAVHEAASRYLNSIEPERFYMRFFSFDETLGEKKSVEQELIEIIKKELEDNYHATVSSVIPKIVNTDIIDLFSDLRGEKGEFQIEVTSLQGGELVKFQGNFQVISVEKDSWYNFQSKFQSQLESRKLLLEKVPELQRQSSRIIAQEDSEDEFEDKNQRVKFIRREACGINNIKEAIEKYLKAKLDTFANNDLQYIDIDDLTLIENIFYAWINDSEDRGSIVKQFGLQISVFSVSRLRTESEIKLTENRQKLRLKEIDSSSLHLESREKYITQLQKELDKLYDKRFKLISQEDSEEELEQVNKKIESIEKEILTPSLEDADSKLKRVEPEKQKSKGFRDMGKNMNLPGVQTEHTLNPSRNPDKE